MVWVNFQTKHFRMNNCNSFCLRKAKTHCFNSSPPTDKSQVALFRPIKYLTKIASPALLVTPPKAALQPMPGLKSRLQIKSQDFEMGYFKQVFTGLDTALPWPQKAFHKGEMRHFYGKKAPPAGAITAVPAAVSEEIKSRLVGYPAVMMIACSSVKTMHLMFCGRWQPQIKPIQYLQGKMNLNDLTKDVLF